MKTKEDAKAFNKKLTELSDEELGEITGGEDFCQIIKDYLEGKLGDREELEKRSRAAGYDYSLVMRAVESRLQYEKRKDLFE